MNEQEYLELGRIILDYPRDAGKYNTAIIRQNADRRVGEADYIFFRYRLPGHNAQVYANNLDDDEAPLYWWPFIPRIECLSNQATKSTNNSK